MLDDFKGGVSMAIKYDRKTRTCLRCGSKIKLSDIFDAEFCDRCDEWLIDKCSDPNCEFCSQRPDKPSQAEKLYY